MPFTLLLDLDDTLLYNDMDTFVPAYLQALSGFMAQHSPPEHFTQALLTATQGMFQNTQPNRTLKETFDQVFYPALHLEEQALRAHIETFYQQVFPDLKRLTRPRAGVAALMQHIQARGWRVVIATNPIFPRIAIRERLAWAGITANSLPITSYEEYHFTKPHPAYYAEILGRLGWPDAPILMVGNDPDLDILPAAQAGLPTWYVTETPEKAPPDLPADGCGTLQNLLAFLQNTPLSALRGRFDTREAALATLRATPAVLDYWRRHLPPEAWQFSLEEGSWSLTENVCHLRDSDMEVNLPRLQIALLEDNPFLPAVNADAWAQERNYRCQDGLEAVQHFTEIRMQLLSLLSELSEPAWQRTVRHGIFGPTTLEELVRFMAAHDRTHLQTIFQLANHRLP